MRKLIAPVLGVLLLGMVAAPVRAFAQPSDPKSLVIAWQGGIRNNDPAALAALFTEDAVVTLTNGDSPDVVFDTPDERAQWLSTIERDDLEIDLLGEPVVNGNNLKWAERYTEGRLKDIAVDYIDVMITTTVEGGKFKTLEFTLTPESIEKINAARAGTTGPVGMPTGAEVPIEIQPTGGTVGMPRSGYAGSAEYLWLIAFGVCSALVGLYIRWLGRGLPALG